MQKELFEQVIGAWAQEASKAGLEFDPQIERVVSKLCQAIQVTGDPTPLELMAHQCGLELKPGILRNPNGAECIRNREP